MGGNIAPRLLLEVYSFDEAPNPVPEYICRHTVTGSPQVLPCYAQRIAYYTYCFPLHVAHLSFPICPTPGGGCVGYGGYLGVGFGVTQTGSHPLTFMSWNACAGFLKGPSAAGEPAACLASSTQLCHDVLDHEGYLVYLNASTYTTYSAIFTIVASADLGHYKLINCHSQYDENTIIEGRAQVAPTQTMICSEVPVEELTWGKIKGLYR
jgi:hypothetical protein